jgi:hypothetical protein
VSGHRRMRWADDTGASLTFALIFITVFSVIIAVLLSFTDTSIRSTVLLRGQATDTAGADGAAQIAINTLRRGTYNGTAGACFGASGNLALPNFYQPARGPAESATVTCELDTAHTAGSSVEITPANRPRNAILTLGTGGGEDGIRVNVADGRDLKVHGPVFSNSSINVTAGSVSSDSVVVARGPCAGRINAVPAPLCLFGPAVDPAGDDPNYPAPTAPTTVQPVPFCPTDNVVLRFPPGLYTDIAGLNSLTRCRNTTLHFPPGTFYFNLPAATPWVIDGLSVVGGTPSTPLVPGTPPTIPGSCRTPIPPDPPGTWTPPAPNSGVRFVLGGGTRIVVRNSQMELCASYSSILPPIAVFGLRTSVGPVPPQSGCVVAIPFPTTGCPVIRAEATSKLHIQGTTFVPAAALDIALNNTAGPLFSAGVVARALQITPTAGSALADPVIRVPDEAPLGRRTVVYLTVYLCPAAPTCDTTTGIRRLRAKIGIHDTTGVPVPGARGITVYSWSVLR